MASIFLQARNRKSQPVLSFLFFEVMNAIYEREGSDSLSMQELVATALVQSGQYTPAQVQANVELVLTSCERIKAMKDDVDAAIAETKADNKRADNKRGFGTKFAKDFEKLDAEGKCLFAADYDFVRAQELYCSLDKAVASKIIKAKFDYTISLQILQFEGVVFGMGGSFNGSGGGGGSSNDDTLIDNSHLQGEEFDKAAAAFMRSLGR